MARPAFETGACDATRAPSGAARLARAALLACACVAAACGAERTPASQAGAPPATSDTAPGLAFAWLVDGAVVLAEGADPAWGTGSSLLEDEDPVRQVRRAADPARVPGDQAARLGERVRVYSLDGSRCEATLSGLRLVGRVVPHIDTLRAWRDEAPEQAAAEAFGLARTLLVADLEPRCEGYFAVAAARPVASVARFAPAAPALAERTLAAARESGAYREKQRRFEERSGAAAGAWEDAGEPARFVLEAGLATRSGTRRFVSVTLHALGESCAEPGDDLWALFEVSGPDASPVLTPRNTPGTFTITPAALLDLDGEVELLFDEPGAFDYGVDRGVVRAREGLYDERESLTIPAFDSPC